MLDWSTESTGWNFGYHLVVLRLKVRQWGANIPIFSHSVSLSGVFNLTELNGDGAFIVMGSVCLSSQTAHMNMLRNDCRQYYRCTPTCLSVKTKSWQVPTSPNRNKNSTNLHVTLEAACPNHSRRSAISEATRPTGLTQSSAWLEGRNVFGAACYLGSSLCASTYPVSA